MKRNKHLILIFTVAFMMFTSVWAGAFGAVQSNAETEEPNPDADLTVMSAEDEAEGITEDEAIELNAKEGSSEYSIAKPTAALDGSTVTVTWAAPVAQEGAPAVPSDVTYTVAAKKGEEPATLEFTVNGTQATATLTDAGTYTFTVTAKFMVGEPAEEVTVTSDPSDGVEYSGTVVPADVTGAKAESLFKGVAVSWVNDTNATGFRIFRYKSESDCKAGINSDKDIDTAASSVQKYLSKDGNRITWNNKIGVAEGQKYWYAIYAYEGTKENMSANPAIVSGQGTFVKRMVITGTFKQSKTLKSHDGYHKSMKFKKGYKMTAQGFSSGEYLFQVTSGGKTYTFWVNRTRIKSPKAVYSKSVSYDKIAEEFINDKGVGSKKNWLIWVSFYTQHVYVFKKSGGKWILKKHWECSTGKASTPSPMALNGLKALNNFRPKTRHALKWWNGYSGKNALHGKKGSWKMGKPKSHGCIRNPNSGAKYIYKNCPKGTRVYTW